MQNSKVKLGGVLILAAGCIGVGVKIRRDRAPAEFVPTKVKACPVPDHVRLVATLTGMPTSLRAALRERYPSLGESSDPFESTDYITDTKSRYQVRLLFAWQFGDRWVVATERGGLGYDNPILAVDLSGDQSRALSSDEQEVFPQSVCSTARSMLLSRTADKEPWSRPEPQD